MIAFTWISGALALGLLFYLIFALLKPERLS
ncbi:MULTISPECIES: K(+)-transporting ATPase subunit F [Sorangium]|uniref:Membrane protein of the Kdp complex n=1 Tax=Sorangium cellulosum (strain So ce56) TaxID=448385 RepID=A9F770_SORC5|nr:K(+)-transporting ATPase subunit F [Sorangium cellulosum]CAN91509.1 putative membrane protein of the Kdp complex [Sorangium cellulosum So ce56]